MDLYGLPNCDTVRKARAWLTEHGIDYRFTDFKKAGVDPEQLAVWAAALGWEVLLNRKGTTWRGLPEAERSLAQIGADGATQVIMRHPSLIKRPVLVTDGKVLAGFSEAAYAALLN